MNRITAILFFLIMIGLPAVSAGEGTVETSSPSASSLPVTRVTLYTAGLAHMVHETEVTDNEVLFFPVEHKDINDILKSLVVEDLGGGTVEAVTFATGDPLSSALGDMRINPSGSPSIKDFLLRTQGEMVTVTTAEGAFAGRIFSVEVMPGENEPKTILNILNEEGIRSIDITSLHGLSYDDPVLREELASALTLIAQSRVKSTKMIKISCTGTGERTVRISYIRAVPLWKTSYRITVDQEGTPRLEGWALVQNTGNAPWEDVQLGFVAGSPNAFTMDLSTPRYVHREQVEIASSAPIGATGYDRGYAPEPAPSMAMEKSYRSAMPMAAEEEMAADYFGGGAYELDDYEEPYVPAPATSRAEGTRSGNFYRYDVVTPVTVEARSSAMIPILVTPDVGSALAVYDPSYNLVFKGIRLKNSGTAHWAAGPATVLEGRYYAGDALLPEMLPETERLLTYAVHGSVEVMKTTTSEPQRIVSLKMADGLLYRTDKTVRETLYRIEGDEKELLLIHKKDAGWKVTDHPEIQEETNGEYRFTLSEWKEPVRVKEEYITSRQYNLINMSLQDYAYYLEWENLSPSMENALKELSGLKREADRIRSQISSVNNSISRLERDQNRVRENMRVLESRSDLYKQYEEQLSSQEDEIQSYNTRLANLQRDLQFANEKLKDYILALDL